MTGAGWRLLAAFLLTLVAAWLHGQDTANRIPVLTPNAALWSYGGPGAPVSPELGPFESKEMTSSIEKLSRSVTVPEWADLRAEVQVSQ